MGAGVAAGPHCPVAGGHQAWEARQSAWGGFETGPGRGPKRRFPGSFARRRPRSGFPAGSPSGPKPWRFAAWRIWNSRSASRLPVTAAEALVPELAGSLAEAAGSAWQVHEPKPWALAGFAAPGTRPSPARQSVRPKPPFLPVAVRKSEDPAFRRASHPSRGMFVLPARFLSPEGVRFRLGALRSLPLSHPLKGKPAASAWRRLRQPPRLRSDLSSGGTQGLLARAVAGKALVRRRSIVSATKESCHEK